MRPMFLIYFLITISSLLSQDRYYKFSELQGFTANDGSTHLLYRLLYNAPGGGFNGYENSIYHYNLASGADTLFLRDFQSGELVERVNSVKFWHNNPSHYIHCGAKIGFAVTGYIQRFDQAQPYITTRPVEGITISRTNDSILYAWNPLMKSTNGGRTWQLHTVSHKIITVSPHNTNLILARDIEGNLVRSTDGGNTFNIVDTNKVTEDLSVNYSPDGNNIFILQKTNSDYRLLFSGNSGAAFSWQTIFNSSSPFIFSHNENENNKYFIAVGAKIYINASVPGTFNLYRELPRKVKGLYSRPTGNFIYAATVNEILMVSPDTIISIKKLPPDPQLFRFLPSEINNTWFYDVTVWDQGWPPVYNQYTQKVSVEKDTLIGITGRTYRKIITQNYQAPGSVRYYRTDSSAGLLFALDPVYNSEYPIHDFLAEPGDTIPYDFNGYNFEFTRTIFDSAFIQSFKGSDYLTKSYHNIFTLLSYSYELAEEIGKLRFHYGYDFGVTFGILKGWIFNGVVFGDTTFTGVKDEATAPEAFKLSQNYPNPFNPSTVIRFSLPVLSKVELKIFDLLGREIMTLVNEEKPAGNYEVEFNALKSQGNNTTELPNGIYFYRLKAGNFTQTRKMILMR